MKKCTIALKGILLGLILVATLAGPFSKAFAVVDVSNFNKVFIGGKNLYADPATGALYDATGNAVQGGDSGTLQETTQAETGKEAVSAATTCNGFWNYWSSPISCTGRLVGVVIASLLIAVTSWLLEISGLLFNWTLNYTVVEFGNFFTGNVKQGVEVGWTVFRDIANIIIIGIFTFVAISIILGLKEFGQKKMIANVLIIAVLINFSLLFTKMIVDASNFSAKQLYDATNIGGQNAQNAQVANIGATLGKDDVSYKFTDAGVAGAFIGLMGVTSGAQTFKTLDAGADALNNGWMAFLHGLFSATLFLAAALVLLYGSFLLISRAILIIFLMITASAAFASYLIPAWAGSSYGWKTWWSSLLKVAVFAPLLMLFLWITISMAKALRPHGGTLGGLLSEPTKAVNLESLFIYIIVLGMLFFSFKLSSLFASRIGGFSMASMVPGIGLGLAGLATGIVGRTLGGWTASRGLTAMRNRGLAYQTQTGQWVGGASSGPASRFLAARLAGLQKASFNPLKTKTVGSVASTFGIPKVLSGAKMGEGGFEGVMARKAKAADDLARKIGPTDDQKRLALADTRRARREQVTQMETLIQTQRETRDQLREHQPGAVDLERTAADAENTVRDRERERDIAAEEHASRIRTAETRAANAQDPATRQDANTEIQRLNAERHEAMAEEAQRIEEARQTATQARQVLEQNHPEITELTRTIDANTRALGNQRDPEPGTLRHAASDAEVTRAGRQADVALRRALLWDKRAAPQIEGEIRAHQRRQNWADFNAAVPPAERDGGATPPAAPPATPATPGGGR
ncbi:hypothetical protein HY971_02775 [Candidatus Kaiserbacteria bacterium]|nr:hypothetical protein [Candidatus Kaiserbacteria bacterium]